MDFNQAFSAFDTQQSYVFLLFLFIAFLFGLWVGRLTRRARIRRLTRELEEKKKALAELEAELGPLREELNLKKADLKKSTFEREELEAKVQRLEADKTKLYREIHNINTELEENKAAGQAHLSNIAELENQILHLKQENDSQDKAAEEEEKINYVAQMQSDYNATRSRLELLEEKMARLEGENQTLKETMGELKEQQAAVPLARAAGPPPAPAETEVEEEPPLDVDFSKERAVMGQKIFLEEEPEKDDLTQIKIIGPFLEKQLNQIGIYTYQQISEFDQTTIDEVTKAIGYFPGRIEKDDWVGQAKRLYDLNMAESPKLEGGTTPAIDPQLENLKLVEGIGPKIEKLLKGGGIPNLLALAESEADHLRAILDSEGDRFRVHDPTTWPAQARLAVNGNWELLKEYQEQLKGGRETTPKKEEKKK